MSFKNVEVMCGIRFNYDCKVGYKMFIGEHLRADSVHYKAYKVIALSALESLAVLLTH